MAYAFAALALGTITCGPAAAQNYGPRSYGGDGYRSGPQRDDGPSRYESDRPRYDGPSRYDPAPNDRPRGDEQPRYEAERLRYDERPTLRRPPARSPARSRFRPAADAWGSRRAIPAGRGRSSAPGPIRANGGPNVTSRPIPPNASEGYRRFWSEENDRRTRTTMSPPSGRRDGAAAARHRARSTAARHPRQRPHQHFGRGVSRSAGACPRAGADAAKHAPRLPDDRGPQSGSRTIYR